MADKKVNQYTQPRSLKQTIERGKEHLDAMVKNSDSDVKAAMNYRGENEETLRYMFEALIKMAVKNQDLSAKLEKLLIVNNELNKGVDDGK